MTCEIIDRLDDIVLGAFEAAADVSRFALLEEHWDVTDTLMKD